MMMLEQTQVSMREAVELGAESLIAYGKIFFPKTFRQKSPKMHEAIGKALYGNSRYNAFEIYRDGAKTTLLRVFTSQRIAYAISRTIMYVSISQRHATYSIRWLKRQVEFNSQWAQTFGLKKGSKWTDEWIEIYHGVEETPITVLAMGITGQIRGFNLDDFRPDLIVVDDILDEENTATVEQRKKIEDLLFGALLNGLAPSTEAPHAKAVFLQTPFNKSDAISKCMEDPQWNPVRFSCFDEQGESTWPERYPTETLRREKEAAVRRGQYRLWMREKECKIVAGEEKALDITRFVNYDVLPEYLDTIIAIDPASSDNEAADDHAIVALGFKGMDVYVLDYHLAKAVMPDEAANHFFALTLMYHPRKAAVEIISYQRILKWYLEQEMKKRRIFVAIQGIQDRRSKANRIMQALPGLISYGHFHIRPSMAQLISQADDYDPNVKDQPDDLIDAIATGIIAMNPQMMAGSDLDGEFSHVNEEEYRELEFIGAP
jgi:hypothetical protein